MLRDVKQVAIGVVAAVLTSYALWKIKRATTRDAGEDKCGGSLDGEKAEHNSALAPVRLAGRPADAASVFRDVLEFWLSRAFLRHTAAPVPIDIFQSVWRCLDIDGSDRAALAAAAASLERYAALLEVPSDQVAVRGGLANLQHALWQVHEICRLAEDEIWLRTRRGPVRMLCRHCDEIARVPLNLSQTQNAGVWERIRAAADFVLVETWEDDQDDEGANELFARSAARLTSLRDLRVGSRPGPRVWEY
eukprot:TRINITY_DN43512_c0_g1_i1.p1 TRINITY_DN43512_c0_g1~~TRINITY_DN43512_c0_g1_i1.p1  ORF type:complete len:249 (-),score=33.53 TRINITY_DN43512_c0_g1_i1:48-794(-)